MTAALQRILLFYRDGFSSMLLGRTLWKVVLIKLVVVLVILKVFFFPDYLRTRFDTDQERAAHVLDRITGTIQYDHR